MVLTRGKSGKAKVVNYVEEDVEGDFAKDDMQPTPTNISTNNEPPRKKLRTNPGPKAVTTATENFQPRPEEMDEEDYELSHGKKRVLHKSASSSRKGKSKAEPRLDTLFDKLPTEVVYKIFAFLHPLDLLRLARTNQMLRSHLMSKASASIWKEARDGVDPPVPACPSDQREPQWAALLFSKDCSNCDRTQVLNINWVHRLRLCSSCNRAGVVLILGTKVKKSFAFIEDVSSLVDFLPYSMGSSSWNRKYYRIGDIQKIGTEWMSIKKKGDRNEVEEFKKRKISELKEIVDTSSRCVTWERSRILTKREEKHNLKESRRNEIFERLEALGHDRSDVRSWTVTSSTFFSSTAQLTESLWNTIRPQLEILVNEAKNERLERQRQRTIRSRERIAETLIDEYYTSANIKPTFRAHFGFRDILYSAVFQDVIQRPNDVSVTGVDFQEALDALPELVAGVSQAIQLDLLQRMVEGGAPDLSTSPTVSNFDALFSATATFFCKGRILGHPLCGLDELDRHGCFPIPDKPKYHCLSYSHPASTAVTALFEAAGLDPSTTAEQMDHRDLRFCCSGCSSDLAMSWRDAVLHARRVEHNELGWEIFSPEDISSIKEIENANTGDMRFRFRCNACPYPRTFRRRQLEDHLRDQHSINGLADPTLEFQATVPPEPVVFSPTKNDSTGMSS